MSEPRIERPEPGRLYLVDADGTRWRVHDCTYAAAKWRRRALGAQAATHRVFTPEDPAAMLRTAHLDTDRALDAGTLARQLKSAGYAERRASARRHPEGPR